MDLNEGLNEGLNLIQILKQKSIKDSQNFIDWDIRIKKFDKILEIIIVFIEIETFFNLLEIIL